MAGGGGLRFSVIKGWEGDCRDSGVSEGKRVDMRGKDMRLGLSVY